MLPISASEVSSPDGSIAIVLPPDSMVPPGSVMLRAPSTCSSWESWNPCLASWSCEYSR